MWSFDGITNVTFYFSADGFVDTSEELSEGSKCPQSLKERILEYLKKENKINIYEEYVGIMFLNIQGEIVFSVTISVGLEDEIYAEVIM